MLYFITDPDDSIRATDNHDDVLTARAEGLSYTYRGDLKSFADAEALAERANASATEGLSYLPTDAGAYVSPQYDVVEVPRVGQGVSYGFNGDCYPDGTITNVGTGAKMVVTTSTGNRYYRRRKTGSWIRQGGTWSLVLGTISRRNPHR